ncbi:hypothetical protein [Microcoleus sp. bin38.metabat.b11b12b14.051]|nr:hypothetical protein [Microcoleus sp. bin38.metabat.b11b12b14.051]
MSHKSEYDRTNSTIHKLVCSQETACLTKTAGDDQAADRLINTDTLCQD